MESALAIAVIAVGLAGAVTMNSIAVKLGRSSSEVGNAEQCVRSLVEMVRNTTWQGVTSTTTLQNTLLAPGTITFPPLSNLTILVEVSPYPLTAGNAAETISVTRSPDGTITAPTTGNPNLPNENAAKVRVNISWIGRRARSQEAVAVISRGGVLGVNH